MPTVDIQSLKNISSSGVSLKQLQSAVAPTSLKSQSRIAVHGVFENCFSKGLVEGSVVGITGSGARSLGFGLIGSIVNKQWTCLLGFKSLGIRAVSEAGIDLQQTLVVRGLNSQNQVRVISECVEATQVVAIELENRVKPADARIVQRKLLNSGGLLIVVGNQFSWPAGVDYTIHNSSVRWQGVEQGHGRISQLNYEVSISGKRSSGPQLIKRFEKNAQGFADVA